MLEREEEIVSRLTESFIALKDRCSVPRERRIFAEAPREVILQLMHFIKNKLGSNPFA